MKIGIDARELEVNPHGGGRVLLNILREWGENTTKHRFVLFFKNTIPQIGFLDSPVFEKKVIPMPSWINRGRIWEQIYIPRSITLDTIDVFFSPYYTIPLRAACPTVVMVHDISFQTHPEWFSWQQGVSWRWFTRRGLQQADKIICCSDFTKQEITAHYGKYLGDKIFTMYYAPQENFKPGNKEQIKRLLASKYKINRPFFLFVGSLFKRRNIPMLIRSFNTLLKNHPDYLLILIGSETAESGNNGEDLASLLKQLGLEDKVLHFDYLDEDALTVFYQGAFCLAYPTVYEGFGFPVVEAMACGVPVIIPNAQSVEEVSAGAAKIVDPLNEENLAEAMAAVIENQELREVLRNKGLARVQKLSWQETASNILNLLETL